MAKKLIGVLKVCLLVFSLLLINGFSMSAKAEEIFNLEKDGFWAPADSVTHSFTIENIWKQECYFDYLKFSGSYIKNTATGQEFTLEDAKELGLIQDYDVVIKLNDSRYGKEVIYNGKLMDLADEKVLLKKDIFMKLDTVVDFTINISFDAMAGNKYQNMQYIYVFYPHAYKINPTPTDPTEPDNPDKPNPSEPDKPDKPNPDKPDTSTPKPNPDTTTPKPDNPDNPSNPDNPNPSNPDNPNPNNPGGGDNPGGNNNSGGGNNQGGGSNQGGGNNQGGGSNNQGGSSNGGSSSNNGGYQSGGGNTKVPVKTGDQNYYSMTILAIVMVISLEIMFLSTGRDLKEEYRKILRRGDA